MRGMQLSPKPFLEAFRLIDDAQRHPQVEYTHIALACMLELNRRAAMDAKISALELNKMEALGRAIAQACNKQSIWPTDPIARTAVYKTIENFNLHGRS
jgi:hypothetical protein